jgi:hypothetical protein
VPDEACGKDTAALMKRKANLQAIFMICFVKCFRRQTDLYYRRCPFRIGTHGGDSHDPRWPQEMGHCFELHDFWQNVADSHIL